MNYHNICNHWNAKLPVNHPLQRELTQLMNQSDEKELEDRFYQHLSFGTAGLRGKIGVGTNRMNEYTVGRTTQGIADFLSMHGEGAKKRGVIISHDCRHFSKEFSELTAEIFAANGISVYVFPDLRPTPELAFLIRELHCMAGINITASHNPKEYNGYKAYWEDGCQVSSKIAEGMTESIQKLDYFSGIEHISFEEGCRQHLITVLGPEYDRKYLDTVESLKIHDNADLDLSIPFVYTPLNGAGSIPFVTMLKDRGFTGWHIVPEQKDPDPDFTTVGYPNPEDSKAFRLSEQLGHQVGAELLMATDPDADRFAIEILQEDGTYLPLNGNQTGYLLVNYLLEGHKDAGTLPVNGAMVKSIVTSTMSSKMAKAYGIKMYETLTGFKNICGLIPFLESKQETYLFGYEESVGYAACPKIRDKDGISAGMLVAEAAAYYKKQGKTLWQVLTSLYETYGFYDEQEPNLILDGIEGKGRISRMMNFVRTDFPKEVAGFKISRIIDYIDGAKDILNPENIIPPTNALRFFLDAPVTLNSNSSNDATSSDSDTWFAIRPSGTEPKIKFYFYTRQNCREKAQSINKLIQEAVMKLIESIN